MCDTFCREKIFSSALVWYLEIQHMPLCLEKSWVAVISSLGKVISPVASPGRACRKSWGTVLSCLEKIRCRIPTPSRPHPRLWPTELRCLLWSQLLGESRLEKSPLVVSLCVTYFLICFLLPDLGVWCGYILFDTAKQDFGKKSSSPAWRRCEVSHLGPPEK